MAIRHRLLSVLTPACVVAVIGLSFLQTCTAQVRRYQPQTPTLSPYLNLTLFNGGGLPNYYAFVRPELQQRAFDRQQQALTRQHGETIQRLENDVQRGITPIAETGTGSWFMIPGKTTYLDTTRYYPAVHLSGRR